MTTIEPASMEASQPMLDSPSEADFGAQPQPLPQPPSTQPAPEPEQAAEAVGRLRELLRTAQPPRWPMYIRQVKQFIRSNDEAFDERKYGFGGIVEFLRACQREGLLRLERDRQGVLRVFPGPNVQRPTEPGMVEPAAAAPERPDGELPEGEPGEGYAPMTEALAEAVEPALGMETQPASEPARSTDEEDLSVGPGNEATRPQDPLAVNRRKPRKAAAAPTGRARKAATPRTPTRAAAARAPRARKKSSE
jgi:hypothetical protein